jgi:hypothetical protein
MKRPIVCACLALLALIAAQQGLRALSFSSTLDPIKIEGRPGEVVNRAFQLTLTDSQAVVHFKCRVEDWWRSEDGKQSFYRQPGLPGNPSRSCARWVSLNPVESAVSPGGTLRIRVSVSIPTDVQSGGYWSVLTVDEVPDPLGLKPGVGVRFLASVSVGIFVYISPLDRAATIAGVTIERDVATVRLRNDGNTPLGVEGRVEFIRPGETKPLATAAIPRGTLLPEPINTGVFAAKLPESSSLPSGRYLVRAIVDIGLDHYIGVQKEMDVSRDASPPLDGK